MLTKEKIVEEEITKKDILDSLEEGEYDVITYFSKETWYYGNNKRCSNDLIIDVINHKEIDDMIENCKPYRKVHILQNGTISGVEGLESKLIKELLK